MSIRKLGPHAQKSTAAGRTWATKANITKQMDGTDLLAAAPDSATRIFRHYVPNQSPNRNATTAANEIIAALGGYRHRNLLVEIDNETGGGNTDLYIPFWREVTKQLHAAGLKVCGPNWGTGDYEANHWALMREVDWCGFDVIGLHAYWANAGLTKWNALRWRQFWKAGDPWIIVTECGRDRVRDGDPTINEGWIGAPGWKAQGVSAETFLAELVAYDAELQKDAYVIGATAFTTGHTPDWNDFSLEEIASRIADLTIAADPPPVVIPPPPVVTPPPPKPPGGTMADITLTGPYKVRICPNFEPNRVKTMGIFIHATRGPGDRPLTEEYANTVGYFMKPGSPSAHLVVGPTEVTRCVHDADAAWHAIENNDTHLGIEVAQPSSEPAFTPSQYAATAEACRLWAAKYNIPLVRVMSQTQPGIIGHQDSEQGKRSGKSDPGAKWDWAKFLALLKPAAPVPAVGTVVNGFEVGPGFSQYIRDHPDIGLPRQAAWADSFGNTYCWLSASEAHPKGDLLIWRKYGNIVKYVDWAA